MPASRGQCRKRETLYHCQLGELTATGAVTCWFEVPEYYDVFACESQIAPPPHAGTICCNQGLCWSYQVGTNNCEIGDIFWCTSGVSNPDGTVTCLDDEGS